MINIMSTEIGRLQSFLNDEWYDIDAKALAGNDERNAIIVQDMLNVKQYRKKPFTINVNSREVSEILRSCPERDYPAFMRMLSWMHDGHSNISLPLGIIFDLFRMNTPEADDAIHIIETTGNDDYFWYSLDALYDGVNGSFPRSYDYIMNFIMVAQSLPSNMIEFMKSDRILNDCYDSLVNIATIIQEMQDDESWMNTDMSVLENAIREMIEPARRLINDYHNDYGYDSGYDLLIKNYYNDYDYDSTYDFLNIIGTAMLIDTNVCDDETFSAFMIILKKYFNCINNDIGMRYHKLSRKDEINVFIMFMNNALDGYPDEFAWESAKIILQS